MSSQKKVNKLELKLPTNNENNNGLKPQNNQDYINTFKEAIKYQCMEIRKIIDEDITDNNYSEIEVLVNSSQDLIENCTTDAIFNGNKDRNFIDLQYLFNKLSLKLETYKLMKEINLNKKKEQETEKNLENLQKDMKSITTTIVAIILAISIIPTAISGIQDMDKIYILPFVSSIIFFGMIMITFTYSIYQDEIKKSTCCIIIATLIITIGLWLSTIFLNLDLKTKKELKNNEINNIINEEVTENIEK